MPIYFVGARIIGFFPFGPVFHGAGLNITVLSNDGHVDVGLIACRELAPDLWRLPGLSPSLAELLDAAARPAAVCRRAPLAADRDAPILEHVLLCRIGASWTSPSTRRSARSPNSREPCCRPPTMRAPSRRWRGTCGYDETAWKGLAQAGLLSLAVPDVARRRRLRRGRGGGAARRRGPADAAAAGAGDAVVRRASARGARRCRRVARGRRRRGADRGTDDDVVRPRGRHRSLHRRPVRRAGAADRRPLRGRPRARPAGGRHARPDTDVVRRTRVHRGVRSRAGRARGRRSRGPRAVRRCGCGRGRRRRARRRARPDGRAPRTRHQFGKPLATFQAVAQQLADVYVVARTVHLASCARELRAGRRRSRHRCVLGRCRVARGAADAATTCTAASASTSPIRCTATTRRPRTSPASSAARAARLDRIGARVRRTDRGAARAAGRTARLLRRRRHARRGADDARRAPRADVPRGRRALGRDGWLGVGWPTEFGGRGFGRARADDLRQRGLAPRRAAART